MTNPIISIITATYNCADLLPCLIASIRNQTDQDFEWVVVDGGSTDGTLELLKDAKQKFKNLIVNSQEDFSIYHALNRGIKLAKGDYYLVVGADDELFPEAIEYYKTAALTSNADLVTASILVDSVLVKPKSELLKFWYGSWAYVSGHSVGLLIRRSLHEHIGYYSKRFPITADQYFILKSIQFGAKIQKESFIAGRYGSSGFSSSDILGYLTETFRVNAECSNNYILNSIIFIFRLLKNYRKLAYRSG